MPSTDSLLVLSYNVSFEASSHWNWEKAKARAIAHGQDPQRIQRPSAWELGEACPEIPGRGRLTECAERQATFIDSIPAAGSNYAFVGLQEASRNEWLAGASTALSGLTRVASRTNNAEMASFYDGTRFKLRHEVTNHEVTFRRPLHLLIFNTLQGPGSVIFINVHNDHGIDFSGITTALVEAFDSLRLSESEIATLAGARVIATGDYNTGVAPVWSPLDPRLSTTVEASSPPKTCCSDPDGDWTKRQPFRAGDFVFDSISAAPCEVPESYPYDKLLSDHLPVMALLDPMP